MKETTRILQDWLEPLNSALQEQRQFEMSHAWSKAACRGMKLVTFVAYNIELNY